jgi:hypothetical protein
VKPIIVCGSRDGQPFGEVESAMSALQNIVEFDSVVVGSRNGTDIRAFNWAVGREMVAVIVPAQWATGTPKGRAAGPARNRRMPRLFPSVVAVAAFPGGTGTEDMCSVAKSLQVPLWRWIGRTVGWRKHT